MDPFALTAQALHEPWRLWTGHLVHFGWEHALANALALAVPLLLALRRDRRPILLSLLVLAPLLSLLLLPSLAGGQYRGASGLACALWALVGLRLAGQRASTPLGLWMLGGLLLKLGTDAAQGGSLLVHAADWQALPIAHLWGALLGSALALPVGRAHHPVGSPFRAPTRGL